MSTFVSVVRLVRPEWFTHMSPEQEAIVERHFLRLQRGIREGQVLLAGPCTDGAFGIVIFDAGSEAEAAAYMDADPAVQGGLMTAELHPFRISLMRGRE